MGPVNAGYSQTLGKGLRVLEVLRHHPAGLGVNALAAKLGLHRTVVYRLLGTLRAHGLVMQDGNLRFRLGVGLIDLAGAVEVDLCTAAAPHLAVLADEVGATAFLTLADGGEAVSAYVVEPRRARMHVGYRTGARHRLEVSAAGIAILAARPALAGERAEVAAARERGYSVTSGELELGAWGLAAAVPVGAAPMAASVGVVAMTELDEQQVAVAVRRAASAVADDVRHGAGDRP
ncbi:helix-turn-helix domain-containing protein [Umezawaea sp. Da 62-37]|uniref:IclR family transcriptional regulator n=1 Tax=Umezawaea sp. Da 62-37 TaxID=3075927 RepID=UPI0028F6F89F|nr:helix-turn-helix domain-containing protein [Umezawaea sp. Da 62-37]WNV82938.1 helix-turn-helix domain-containing protein [Umezawaea sp. Da 62-37]